MSHKGGFKNKRPDLYKYLIWKKEVLKRDKYRCKKCQCRVRKALQVHHIRRYEDFPTLRHLLSNGITLCKSCHKQMKGNEEGWERLCFLLIGNKGSIVDVGNLLRKEKLNDEI